jgi:hypothetical protein
MVENQTLLLLITNYALDPWMITTPVLHIQQQITQNTQERNNQVQISINWNMH